MAARPDILLQGRVPDVGATFRNALLNVQGVRGLQQAQAQAEREAQLQPLRDRLLQAQATTAEQGVLTPGQVASQRDQARLESIANFSQFALPGLQSGDIEGTRAALQQRRQSLTAAAGQGQQVDTREVDEALQLLDTNPQLLAQRMGQAIQAQQAIKARGGKTGLASAKTEFLPGGGSLQALPSGEIIAKDEQNRVVTGPARQDLLDRSQQFQLSLAKAKADISVDAETKKAAAKAGIDLKTKPEIEAAVAKAVSTVKAVTTAAGEQKSNQVALNAYSTAMKGLVDALAGTDTGPFVGLLPSLTANQQIADGAIAAVSPILKDVFRGAGEGTFTDSDQALLNAMIPTRKDKLEARQSKLQNIDAIVRAKLNAPSRKAAPSPSPSPSAISAQDAIPVGAPPSGRQGGTLMTDAQGNKAFVFPDGSFEEVQ